MNTRRIGWLILLLAGCGGGSSDTAPPALPTPIAAPQIVAAFPNLSFTAPLFITHAGDASNRLFVVEQAGRILVFTNTATVTSTSVFLDIRSRVLSGGEQGMLGLAFDPGYASNGFFYVYYMIDAPRRGRVSRFRVSMDPNQADTASETVLLEFDDPFENHNGGMLVFGADGKLYIALGDGGSGGDPNNNAQNLGTILGKILRINPNGAIPADNPFVGTVGARGEIWAYGLRNPWRMSFDRVTGRLWAGDVGQSAREEIDIIVRGGNYGWRFYEGTASFNNPDARPLDDFIAPVYEYGRDIGRSITGGYVYRGPGVPSLVGAYMYADFITGKIWALVHDGTSVVSNTEIATLPNPSSFGEDESGEIYITSFDGKIYRFRQM